MGIGQVGEGAERADDRDLVQQREALQAQIARAMESGSADEKTLQRWQLELSNVKAKLAAITANGDPDYDGMDMF